MQLPQVSAALGLAQGRTIAALMKEHFATGGTRALWVSTSRDLGFDALRDLQDVHADIDIHPKVNIATSLESA